MMNAKVLMTWVCLGLLSGCPSPDPSAGLDGFSRADAGVERPDVGPIDPKGFSVRGALSTLVGPAGAGAVVVQDARLEIQPAACSADGVHCVRGALGP